MDKESKVVMYGTCDKCGTLSSEVFEFEDGRWLCKANCCFQEELEKIDGRIQNDLDSLEKYRDWVSRTGITPVDEY